MNKKNVRIKGLKKNLSLPNIEIKKIFDSRSNSSSRKEQMLTNDVPKFTNQILCSKYKPNSKIIPKLKGRINFLNIGKVKIQLRKGKLLKI